MKLPTADIRKYIQNKVAAHFRDGGVLIELVSGDIERELKIKDCTPQVCGVMQETMERHPHHVVERPFKWQGTRLQIRYYKDTETMYADDRKETIVRPPKVNLGRQMRVKAFSQQVKGTAVDIKKVTVDELKKAAELVAIDKRYGEEGVIIKNCFSQFPKNTDDNIIAMKMALIDMTNSTNLNLHLGKVFLTDLIAKIKECNFDERVARGDISLVSELANTGTTNLFSFFSKYCLYHNFYLHERDDFVIFDSVMQKHVGKYISEYEYDGVIYRSTKIHDCIEQMRITYDYDAYRELIDTILENNRIKSEYRHRKFDWLVWYHNRRKTKKGKKKVRK